MNILIVDREATAAINLAWDLEGAGYVIIGPVASNDEALELASAFVPDLALVDISLSDGYDGRDLAESLRGKLGVPSVLTAAQANLTLDDVGVALGLIVKPYRSKAVIATLETFFNPPPEIK